MQGNKPRENKGRRGGRGLAFNRDGVSLHVCSGDAVTEEGRPKAKKTTGKSTLANEGPTSTPGEESNDLATLDSEDNPYNPTGEGPFPTGKRWPHLSTSL